MRQFLIFLLFAATVGPLVPPRLMAFDLQFSIVDSGGQFTTTERDILDAALARAERMWETVITGYQPNIIIGSIPISIYPTTSGLAAATYSSTTY